MKQEIKTTQPDSKEGLHTQGEERFTLLLNEGTDDETVTTLEEYISPFDEDMDDDFIKVVNLNIGETYQYGADAIKRISPPKAVNERKALLDALTIAKIVLRRAEKNQVEGATEALSEIKNVLNNTKNI